VKRIVEDRPNIALHQHCIDDEVRRMPKLSRSVVGLAPVLLLTAALLGTWPHAVCAQGNELAADAHRALSVLFEALRSGDPDKVGPLLAPEFQLVRSNGGAFDKEQYLKNRFPKIEGQIAFDDLVVTRNADIVVARTRLKISAHIDGKRAESGAPQLFVFRITPSGWQVVASANFAKLTD
jgi:hypothetical protein